MFSFKNKAVRSAPTPPVRDRRKELIHEEMQFLLMRDPLRFRQQLRARLLEEGCNLPLCLGYPLFCHHLQKELTSRLYAHADAPGPSVRPKSDGPKLFLPAVEPHARFYKSMRAYASRATKTEEQMAMAVQEAMVSVIAAWQLPPEILTHDPALFGRFLTRILSLIAQANPDGAIAGQLPHIGVETPASDSASSHILRRLVMALTTSLLRHTRRPQLFFDRFESVPRLLSGIQTNPDRFCRAMDYFREQVPYFAHITAQTFWRTLSTLDLELNLESNRTVR